MSMFLKTENGCIISFSNYCLSESIKPRTTDWGTNIELNDRVVKHHPTLGAYYAFFNASDAYWVVFFAYADTKAEVGFATSNEFSLNLTSYTINRQLTSSALKVFNKVFFVIIEMLAKPELKEINTIYFDAANPALGKVYDRLQQNKFFLSHLEDAGFVFDRKEDGYHYFTRKR